MIYRLLVVSAKGSLVTGQKAWERVPWMKMWSYMAVGHLLRESFEPGSMLLIFKQFSHQTGVNSVKCLNFDLFFHHHYDVGRRMTKCNADAKRFSVMLNS